MEQVMLDRQELPYAIAEEIKSLRTNIQFCGADKKVILITSSSASEGKSTVSLEVARSLADLGKNVLLLDTDLRRSELYKLTENKFNNYTGLSHYLSGQASGKDIVYQAAQTPGLHIVFAGHVPPNPAELLANARMSSLIDWAKSSFDYVIVDAPPVNLVADASIVAPMCDGVIFVIKEGVVPRKIAMNGFEQLQRTGCTMLGVILNQVKTGGRGKYYYNRYYKKYYKKYGSYYGQEEET